MNKTLFVLVLILRFHMADSPDGKKENERKLSRQESLQWHLEKLVFENYQRKYSYLKDADSHDPFINQYST